MRITDERPGVKRPTRKIPEKDQRQKDLAKIHIAKKELGLDDDTYHQVLDSICGASSAAELTAAGRQKLLKHLERCGFKPAKKPFTPRVAGRRPRNMENESSRAAQLGKIEALLRVGGKSWEYGHALARRICKADDLTFVPSFSLYKIVTALRKQAVREGWDLSGERK